MNYCRLKLMFKFLLCLTFVAFFSSSLHAGGSFTFKWGNGGNDSEPQQQQAKQEPKKAGPPAHAPAHGNRAKHKYRYYPDQKVYQDTDRGLYFYLNGGNWEVGVKLPSHLSAGLGESVTLELDTDKPHVYNGEHIKKYPPKKSNSKKRKKLAKKK